MSEEERRRSFAGKDCSLLCHDKGLDFRSGVREIRVRYHHWRLNNRIIIIGDVMQDELGGGGRKRIDKERDGD